MLINREKFWKKPATPMGLEDYVDSMLCPRWDPDYYSSIVESMVEYHLIPDMQWTVVEKPQFRSFFAEWKNLGAGMLRGYVAGRWRDDQQTFKRCCGKLVESAISERLSGQTLTKSALSQRLSSICERDGRFVEKPRPEHIAAAVDLIKLIVVQGHDMFLRLGTPHDWGLRVYAQTDTVTSGQVDVLVTSEAGHEMLVDIKAAAHLGSFHRDAQRVAGVPTSPKNEVQTLLYLILLAADESITVPRFVVLVNPLLGVFEMLDVHRAVTEDGVMSVIEHLGYRALMLDESRCETAMRRISSL